MSKVVCVCVKGCSYPLAVSQVDLSEGGVELRWGLTLVVLIQKDWRTTHLHTQLLCALVDKTDVWKKLGEYWRGDSHQTYKHVSL